MLNKRGETEKEDKEIFMNEFQNRVYAWMLEVFPEEVISNHLERIIRFLEEAVELGQAEGLDRDAVLRVVDYVFNRPVGEVNQEVGGVMVTLAAYCSIKGLNLNAEATREIDRIDTPEMMEKIRGKQAFKRAQGLTADGGFNSIVKKTLIDSRAVADQIDTPVRITLGMLRQLLRRNLPNDNLPDIDPTRLVTGISVYEGGRVVLHYSK